jgi:hypothetical protein
MVLRFAEDAPGLVMQQARAQKSSQVVTFVGCSQKVAAASKQTSGQGGTGSYDAACKSVEAFATLHAMLFCMCKLPSLADPEWYFVLPDG